MIPYTDILTGSYQCCYRSGVMLNEDFFMATQTTNLTPGQIVRVTNNRSTAYGRIARVTADIGGGGFKISFVDLPLTSSSLEVQASEMYSNHEYLTPIEGVPSADFYLVIKIAAYPLPDHCYYELCIAHGNGQNHEQFANSVAQHWYESDSEWDEKSKAYVFLLDRRIEVVADNYEEISLAQYIQLRNWMKDCTPGYAGYAGAISSGL